MLRAVLKFAALAALTLVTVPLQMVVLLFHKGRHSFAIPRFWHRGVCAVLGIKVTREGRLPGSGQAFYVSNHLSYLDVPAMGSIIEPIFIARADLSGWPVFGFLSKLQRTVFISRDRKDALKVKTSVSAALAQGRPLVLFAEGTSSRGDAILPFKSSLLSIPLSHHGADTPLLVQPVTISLMSVTGQKGLNDNLRDVYAWHGEMTLGPHIWAFAKGRGAHIRITFHTPLDLSVYTDRKKLAADCAAAVGAGLFLPEKNLYAA